MDYIRSVGRSLSILYYFSTPSDEPSSSPRGVGGERIYDGGSPSGSSRHREIMSLASLLNDEPSARNSMSIAHVLNVEPCSPRRRRPLTQVQSIDCSRANEGMSHEGNVPFTPRSPRYTDAQRRRSFSRSIGQPMGDRMPIDTRFPGRLSGERQSWENQSTGVCSLQCSESSCCDECGESEPCWLALTPICSRSASPMSIPDSQWTYDFPRVDSISDYGREEEEEDVLHQGMAGADRSILEAYHDVLNEGQCVTFGRHPEHEDVWRSIRRELWRGPR